MRALVLVTPILASVLISNSVTAEAGQRAGSASSPAAGAPIVHVQPRADDFSPNSSANKVEQKRLSTFDAKQEKLDDALDKSLNIYRC